MKLRTLIYNTFPNKKDNFWQVVLLPTVAVLNSGVDDYIAVNFEWLFFSLTLLFSKNDKTRQFTT